MSAGPHEGLEQRREVHAALGRDPRPTKPTFAAGLSSAEHNRAAGRACACENLTVFVRRARLGTAVDVLPQRIREEPLDLDGDERDRKRGETVALATNRRDAVASLTEC